MPSIVTSFVAEKELRALEESSFLCYEADGYKAFINPNLHREETMRFGLRKILFVSDVSVQGVEAQIR